ncbi:MAG TPA: NAD(P)H-binding protein, partial [Myxococcota bacterium]
MPEPTLLITGASGSVGRHLVAALAQRGLRVRAASRDPAKAKAALPAEVDLVRADLADAASMRAALTGIARVFLYATLADADAMRAIFRDTGVRHIVLLSSSSAASDGTADGDFNALRFRAFEAAVGAVGVDTTFLRPGEFSSNALGWRHSIKSARAIRLPYPDAVQTPIDQRDIA